MNLCINVQTFGQACFIELAFLITFDSIGFDLKCKSVIMI